MISLDQPRAATRARDRLRAPTPAVIGLITFAITLLVLVVHNRAIFTTPLHEDGDFAVNSILIDRAKHLQLLVGNYSRVGFNHPGPAFLYVQAFSELLFRDLIPLTRSPYGAHALGALILDSALVGICASILFAHTRSVIAPLSLLVIVLAYGHHEPGLLTSTWMPNLYVWPFLLLVVAGASVLAGRRQDLWAATLAACFLVHGHVSFAVFVGLATALVVASLVLHRRRSGAWDVPAWSVRASGGIIALFALPIVVNLLLNWPGELDDYLRYSRSDDAGGHPFAEVIAFVKDYWVGNRGAGFVVAVLVVALAAVVWFAGDLSTRPLILGLLAMVAAMTIAMIFYAARGVDDLSFRYVGRFYYAAPMVVILGALLVIGFARQSRSLRVPIAIVLLIALAWFATRSELDDTYAGADWVPAAADLVAGAGTPTALRFDATAWPQAAGIVEALRRDGRDVCVDAAPNPLWPVLFTERVVCTPSELSDWTVIDVLAPGTAPAPDDLLDNAYVVLRRASA